MSKRTSGAERGGMFIFLAIIGLSVLVFFHELGHFLIAKILGIKVEEFGIGYPPRIFGFILPKKGRRIKFFLRKNKSLETGGQTIYSLNLIPFGGFNKLKGEFGGDKSEGSFYKAAWWKKVLVGIGGSGMNIVLAIIIFSFLYFTGIPQDIDSIKQGGKVSSFLGIQIGMVSPDSPADKHELKMGDIITQIDDYQFDEIEKIQEYIKARIGQSINVKIRRGEEVISKNIEVLPYNEVFSGPLDQIAAEEEGIMTHGVIGVALSKSAIVVYPIYQAIIMGVNTTFSLLGRLFYGIWLIFKTLLTSGEMMGGFFGPVGITVMTAEIARAGYMYLFQFIAFLSVAIGAFQLIPFPALDGSRVVFAIIEGIKGKPIDHRKENIIIGVGFYLLLTLLVFITVREIIGLF